MADRAEKLVSELGYAEGKGDVTKKVHAMARRHRWRVRLFRFIVGVGFLVLWELASGPLVKPFWISCPSAVFVRLWEWTYTGFIFYHTFFTFLEMVIGFVIGTLIGIIVGFILGRNEMVAEVLDPYIMAAFAMPKIALAPLFILWFGIGLESKVILVVVIVFFLVFFNTFNGVRDVDPDLIDISRVMGASEIQIMRKIVLPSALIWIFTGLKLSIPYSLIGAVIGEIIASYRGLGYLVQDTSGMFDTTGLFSALFVLTIVAVVINEFCARSERYFLKWR